MGSGDGVETNGVYIKHIYTISGAYVLNKQ